MKNTAASSNNLFSSSKRYHVWVKPRSFADTATGIRILYNKDCSLSWMDNDVSVNFHFKI